MEKLRPVEVTLVKYNAGVRTEAKARGMFHTWGKTWEEVNDTAVESTVAIVELEAGEVETVIPDRVRFLDAKPPEDCHTCPAFAWCSNTIMHKSTKCINNWQEALSNANP